MSRLRILVLLAVAAALGTAFAACGGGSSQSEEDPHKVIESATLKGVESGELEMSLSVKSEGKESGNVDVSLSGPFQGAAGKGQLPELAMEGSAHGQMEGEKLDFEGGLTLLSDRAFVSYEGDEYEVDPTTFGFLKSGLEQAEKQGGAEAGEVTACQKAAEGLKFSQFVDNLKNEGSAEVGGTSTTKISGELNPSGAVEAVLHLTEDPSCAGQLEAAGPLPLGELEKAKGEVSSAVKNAHADLYVGEDHIVRKFDLEMTVEPKEAGAERVEVQVEVALNGVNEEQSISAPASAKPLEALFQKLGVNPLELLEAGSSGSGGGIGGLLEGLQGGSGGGLGGSGGGASSGGGGGAPSAGKQQAYVECLQGAKSAADIQRCASLLK